jgi:hypothetical protein
VTSESVEERGQGLPPPEDTSLPLFAYGAFRPGELAHDQLEGHVRQARPAVLTGYELRLRDGLPALAISEEPFSDARGDLLQLDEKGYEVVRRYEPRAHFKWVVEWVDVDGQPVKANLLVAKRPNQGSEPEPLHEWRGRFDPLFGEGLAAIGEAATQAVRRPAINTFQPGFWHDFIELQGLYLTTWTVAERLAAMRFGPNANPNGRISNLDKWPAVQHAVAEAHPPFITVVSAQDPDDRMASNKKPFGTWYQARSNMSHRGKGAMTDVALITKALIGLHDTLRILLASQLPELDRVWSSLEVPGARLKSPWIIGSTNKTHAS